MIHCTSRVITGLYKIHNFLQNMLLSFQRFGWCILVPFCRYLGHIVCSDLLFFVYVRDIINQVPLNKSTSRLKNPFLNFSGGHLRKWQKINNLGLKYPFWTPFWWPSWISAILDFLTQSILVYSDSLTPKTQERTYYKPSSAEYQHFRAQILILNANLAAILNFLTRGDHMPSQN